MRGRKGRPHGVLTVLVGQRTVERDTDVVAETGIRRGCVVTEKKPEETRVPWLTRGKAALLAAGAIAGALLALFALWDRIFPPDLVDAASIGSVDVIRQASLSDFASARLSNEMWLQPGGEAHPAMLFFKSVPVSVETTGPQVTSEPEIRPSESPTEPSTAPSEPSTTPSETSPSPSVSSTSSDPPQSPRPSPTPLPTTSTNFPTIPPELVEAVAGDEKLAPFAEMTQEEVTILFFTVVEPIDLRDPQSQPSAEEVAEGLADALVDVETVGVEGDKIRWGGQSQCN